MSQEKPAPDNSGKLESEDNVRYDVLHLGNRLRQLRKNKRLTISELAALADVPISTISKIENDQMKPSLVHAINLSDALDENLGFLVDSHRSHSGEPVIVRREDRGEINYLEMGLSLQDITGIFLPKILEARIGKLKPGADSGDASMRHPGEEICFVLEGRIRYAIDDGAWELEPGHSIHFKSDLPHRWENVDEGETVVIWVFSDGLSF